MKTILLLLLAVPVMASCPKGCEEYQGACACLGTPEMAPSVKPSNEVAPRDKMPSYEREGVKAATPPSLAVQDSNQDQQRIDADRAGKSAAGVP